jgi:hypothetical protein
MDGGTLFPTLNKDYPVVQYYSTSELIPFPAHAVARVYMSPRPELLREGWGLAPPEKVFLALEMLIRGDRYYANLLMDTPPAGLLDLGDMEQASALEWITAFKNTMGNPLDALKIPVLYEHTTKAEFIPFGKPPTDIMYDRITMKYAEIVCAAYGLSLSDIGMSSSSNGGETLAGSIRQERKSRRTGIGRVKRKVIGFMDSILPDELQFQIVDLDDELSVSMGRARLASATAWGQLITNGIFAPEEARLQTIADGLITINVPEAVPPEAKKAAAKANATPRPGLLGKPVPASGGGQGEIRQSLVVDKSKNFNAQLKRLVRDLIGSFAPILVESSRGLSEDDLYLLRSYVDDSMFGEDVLGITEIIKSAWGRRNWIKLSGDMSELAEHLRVVSEQSMVAHLESEQAYRYENSETDDLVVDESVLQHTMDVLRGINFEKEAQTLIDSIQENIKEFIGKSILYIAKDVILSEDGFDISSKSSYDNVVGRVFAAMFDNFDEWCNGCIDLEIDNTLDRIKLEALNG